MDSKVKTPRISYGEWCATPELRGDPGMLRRLSVVSISETVSTTLQANARRLSW